MLSFLRLLALWAAAQGPLEASCRDRYENGTPGEIRNACRACIQKEPRNLVCRRLLALLMARPKLSAARQPTEAQARQSRQHYLSGMVYFQKQNYEKARSEWHSAQQLDPGNSDAAAGLERLEKLAPRPVEEPRPAVTKRK